MFKRRGDKWRGGDTQRQVGMATADDHGDGLDIKTTFKRRDLSGATSSGPSEALERGTEIWRERQRQGQRERESVFGG